MTNDQDLKAAEEWIARNETNDRDGDIREYHLEKAFLAGLAAGRKEREWVSAKDSLPTDSREVLVRCRNGEQFVCFWDDSLWRQLSDARCIDFVTHWMPLPDAPKEGK